MTQKMTSRAHVEPSHSGHTPLAWALVMEWYDLHPNYQDEHQDLVNKAHRFPLPSIRDMGIKGDYTQCASCTYRQKWKCPIAILVSPLQTTARYNHRFRTCPRHQKKICRKWRDCTEARPEHCEVINFALQMTAKGFTSRTWDAVFVAGRSNSWTFMC